MSDLEEYLLVVDEPEYIKEFLDMQRRAIDYALIVEQFQKLLGVYTTTSALAKVAVLMREETEAEEFIRKVRDGLFHYPNHPDEPCSCNEKAAAEFMSGLTPRALDECPQCHAKNPYTDQQTYPGICSQCGTRQ
jgi:hypothetical protein